MSLRPATVACLLLAACAGRDARAEDVTIYRCVDAKGNLALRDSPCAKGETQQVRAMQRPKDPAPVATPAATATTKTPAPAPVREVQVIYRTPPRPLYECVTPDGERYTSENGDGNPRSVPVWTLGAPIWPSRGGHGGRGDAPPPPTNAGSEHVGVERSSGSDRSGYDGGSRGGRHRPGGYYGGGVAYTLVRDECHALPQQEVCSRLSDRRYEIIRRYNSALQSERRQLEQEQRGIEARMDQDCGNR